MLMLLLIQLVNTVLLILLLLCRLQKRDRWIISFGMLEYFARTSHDYMYMYNVCRLKQIEKYGNWMVMMKR